MNGFRHAKPLREFVRATPAPTTGPVDEWGDPTNGPLATAARQEAHGAALRAAARLAPVTPVIADAEPGRSPRSCAAGATPAVGSSAQTVAI